MILLFAEDPSYGGCRGATVERRNESPDIWKRVGNFFTSSKLD
jgi:hypothetical protein